MNRGGGGGQNSPITTSLSTFISPSPLIHHLWVLLESEIIITLPSLTV